MARTTDKQCHPLSHRPAGNSATAAIVGQVCQHCLRARSRQGQRHHSSSHSQTRKSAKNVQASPCSLCPQSRIEPAMEQMETEGSLEKMDHCEWATPVVPVVKPDGMVRICGDFKVTLNPCLQVPQHPLPRKEDCFHAMNGGQKFSKVDPIPGLRPNHAG